MIKKEKTPQDWLKQIKRPKNVALLFVAVNLSNIVIGTYTKEYDIWTNVSVFFVLTALFFIILWFLYNRYIMGGKIEYIENGITQLLEREKLVCSPEELFNFNRRTFGHFYNKVEINQKIKNDGGGESVKRTCLVMEDKGNVLKYKDYYMKIDKFPTQEKEKEEGFQGLSSKVEVAKEKKDNHGDTTSIGPATCDGESCCLNDIKKFEEKCEHIKDNLFIKEFKVGLLEESPNKVLMRYHFDGGLKGGNICRYNIIDNWPAKTFAITEEDLNKKNKFLEEEIEEKIEKETYYFKVVDPIKYLKICLEFPNNFSKTVFTKKVILGDDENYIIHSEMKRFYENLNTKNGNNTKQVLILEIKYPIIGLKYGVEWSPSKN